MFELVLMRERLGKHAMPASHCVTTDRQAACRSGRHHTYHPVSSQRTRYQGKGAEVSAAAPPLPIIAVSCQPSLSDPVDYSRVPDSRWASSGRVTMMAVRVDTYCEHIVNQTFAYVATNAA
jgi:hypothetical protein